MVSPGRAHELAEVQRDALGCAEDGLLAFGRKRPSRELVQELPFVLVGQRAELEHDLVGIRVPPGDERVRLVARHRPKGRDDEDPIAPRDLAEPANGVQRARVAPVQILQTQDDRTGEGFLRSERRDGSACGEGLEVEPRPVFAADETRRIDPLPSTSAGVGGPNEIAEAGERRALLQCVALPLDPGHVGVPGVPASFGEQTALPDPGFADARTPSGPSPLTGGRSRR